jgi:hypothetical protein
MKVEKEKHPSLNKRGLIVENNKRQTQSSLKVSKISMNKRDNKFK